MTTPQNRAEPPRKLEILLAEDNMVNRVLAQKLLQKSGHTVILAKNGKEAVALWEANRLRQFDAILMDIQMPIMDGLQTTAYIRAREKALHAESPTPEGPELHIPIVAMTAHAMKGDRERYLAGGMDGYISKPINSVELEQVIQSALARSSPRVSSPVVASENVNSVTSREIEEARILARLDGDTDLARELSAAFLIEYPKHLHEMHAAIRAGNAKAMEHSAHTLKGSIGNFSIEGAHESALKLEMLSRSGDLTAAPEILKTLEEQLVQLNQLLWGLTRDGTKDVTKDVTTDVTKDAVRR